MKGTSNLAARAGAWSARHGAAAIAGWLALVVVAVLVGGSIGTKELEDEDLNVGEARAADRVIADAFPENAGETVLVQSEDAGTTADEPAFRAAVDDVVTRLESTRNVIDVQSPYFAGGQGVISRDRRSALVTFEIPDPGEDSDVKTEDLVEAPLATVRRVSAAHRGSGSMSSATRVPTRRSARRSRTTSARRRSPRYPSL